MSDGEFDFYYKVIVREGQLCNVTHASVTRAIKHLQRAYCRISKRRKLDTVNYNDSSHRIAYAYLYAICHTTAVSRQLSAFRKDLPVDFHLMMLYDNEKLYICSLGGGPGVDIIGMLSERLNSINAFAQTTRIRCTVVDICRGWTITLKQVFEAYLESSIGEAYRGIVSYNFVESDLENYPSKEAIDAVRKADILNLVKFVSVVSYTYNKDPGILENIFNAMKIGAYVFFLDNAGGGFFEITSKAANRCGLILVAPPTRNRWDTSLDQPRTFGPPPLNSTSVCFALWKKRECRAKVRRDNTRQYNPNSAQALFLQNNPFPPDANQDVLHSPIRGHSGFSPMTTGVITVFADSNRMIFPRHPATGTNSHSSYPQGPSTNLIPKQKYPKINLRRNNRSARSNTSAEPHEESQSTCLDCCIIL